jgi:hypothetical protein
LKQLQEAVGNTLEQIGTWNDFLNRTEKLQHLRETMNKWDCIKLKRFCTAKETVTRLKRQPTEWEKIFASYSSSKRLISRIYILNSESHSILKKGLEEDPNQQYLGNRFS